MENRKKIVDLKYNSPTYKQQNLIAHREEPFSLNYKPHTKATQYSYIDHLANNVELPVKRGLGKSEFNHLQNCTTEQKWKPSVKKIPEKQSVEADESHPKQNKNASYQSKYDRNPITDPDKMATQKGIKISQKFKESSQEIQFVFNHV